LLHGLLRLTLARLPSFLLSLWRFPAWILATIVVVKHGGDPAGGFIGDGDGGGLGVPSGPHPYLLGGKVSTAAAKLVEPKEEQHREHPQLRVDSRGEGQDEERPRGLAALWRGFRVGRGLSGREDEVRTNSLLVGAEWAFVRGTS
jgi:hypothetical protein